MLLIDSREDANDKAASLRAPLAAHGAPVIVTPLDAGDIVIVDASCEYTVAIELKKPDDFIASMRSGRLGGANGQAERMTRFHDYSFVMVYGRVRRSGAGFAQYEFWRGGGKFPKWRDLGFDGRGVKWSEWIKHITALQLAKGVGWLRVETDQELLETIEAMYWWMQEQEHATLSRMFQQERGVKLLGRTQETPPAVRMLMTIDGLGEKRAKAIVTEMGGLWAIYEGGEKALRKRVKGIGKSLAAKVRRDVSIALNAQGKDQS